MRGYIFNRIRFFERSSSPASPTTTCQQCRLPAPFFRLETSSPSPLTASTRPSPAIEDLLSTGFPHLSLVSVTPLPEGRSYNNRIYYLEVLRQENQSAPSTQSPPPPSGQTENLVLKVNGRFFGADKIENEVSILRLLMSRCPEIPVPRIVAWSRDGESMSILHTTTSLARVMQRPSGSDWNHGWILMTRVPGEPISILDLDEPYIKYLMVQLADHVAAWRRAMPLQTKCGNIRFRNGEFADCKAEICLNESGISDADELVVRGMLGEGLKRHNAITSYSEYHCAKIENKLKDLEASNTYAPSRSLARRLRSFLDDNSSLLHRSNPSLTDIFFFTHYDLSPRNILVSVQPNGTYLITGIVDFEFSGFFPPMDEFLNDSISNEGDWPPAAYQAYLDRLEQKGVATPVTFSTAEWDNACQLEKLVQNIAPWWLPGEYSGKELDGELAKSRLIAEEMLESLYLPP